jgi:hypothetical protein
MQTSCRTCLGSGFVDSEPCEECVGVAKLSEIERVQSALDSYGKVPDEVWIGSNSIADKVQWLVNRCIGSDATISRLRKENAALPQS